MTYHLYTVCVIFRLTEIAEITAPAGIADTFIVCGKVPPGELSIIGMAIVPDEKETVVVVEEELFNLTGYYRLYTLLQD